MAEKKIVKASVTGNGDAEGSLVLAKAYAERIEGRRQKIEAGDGDELLAAIRDAALGRIALPDWLSGRVLTAIRRYTHHEVSTLDLAFNVKRPKGYRRPAVRGRWEKAVLIVRDVCKLNMHGVSIDDGMFEEVGKLHGIKKSQASDWYYFHKNNNTLTYVSATAWSWSCESLPDRLNAVAEALRK